MTEQPAGTLFIRWELTTGAVQRCINSRKCVHARMVLLTLNVASDMLPSDLLIGWRSMPLASRLEVLAGAFSDIDILLHPEHTPDYHSVRRLQTFCALCSNAVRVSPDKLCSHGSTERFGGGLGRKGAGCAWSATAVHRPFRCE